MAHQLPGIETRLPRGLKDPQGEALVPPAALVLTGEAGDTVHTLEWESVPDATWYTLYWSLATPVTTDDNVLDEVTSPYEHTGRTNGTTYYYAATASNEHGESDLSNEVELVWSPPPPDAPVLTGEATDTVNTLEWDPVTDATSYTLYWSLTSPVTKDSTKITGATSPYEHTGRTNGVNNYYAVTASNENGESDLSNEVALTVSYLYERCDRPGASMASVRIASNGGDCIIVDEVAYHKATSPTQPSSGAVTATPDTANISGESFYRDDDRVWEGTNHNVWTACEMAISNNIAANKGAVSGGWATIFTAPSAGVVRVWALPYQAAELDIKLNGTLIVDNGGDQFLGSHAIRVAAGDVIDVWCYGAYGTSPAYSFFLPDVYP